MSRPQARPSRPRIVDVAALAGVSAQTVSNVINGRGGFGGDTRLRVEAAIEQLGFQPNRYAQSLRSRRTMLLGFDLSGEQLEVDNPFSVSFLRALVRAANVHGYRVVAFMHEGTGDFKCAVSAGAVDGFVLSDSPPDDPRTRVLVDAGVPFAVFGRTAADLPQTWVDIDNRQAIGAAVDHLVTAGHRTFGYVGHREDVYWIRERHEGARDRLRLLGHDLDGHATVICAPADVTSRVRELLRRPDRPTALITSSDSIALRVVNIATSLGLRVGHDVAVTGFDAGPLRVLVEPPLTTVRIPVDRIAVRLVERLMSAVRGSAGSRGEIVPTELVLGATA